MGLPVAAREEPAICPLAFNPGFTGREADLESLGERLKKRGEGALDPIGRRVLSKHLGDTGLYCGWGLTVLNGLPERRKRFPTGLKASWPCSGKIGDEMSTFEGEFWSQARRQRGANEKARSGVRGA
jgi:hypothetical protein